MNLFTSLDILFSFFLGFLINVRCHGSSLPFIILLAVSTPPLAMADKLSINLSTPQALETTVEKERSNVWRKHNG